jgi:hypothetical protein
MILMDERKFSELNHITQQTKPSNGAKEKLSGCHQSPQPLDSFSILVKYILVKDDFF